MYYFGAEISLQKLSQNIITLKKLLAITVA